MPARAASSRWLSSSIRRHMRSVLTTPSALGARSDTGRLTTRYEPGAVYSSVPAW